ncbi:hypothetical protein NMY22_g17864 [Coprinellus aureogranulatus]|nr:hypothetical protein NMY22_g17864 [Coprinellus aureogranulatus]
MVPNFERQRDLDLRITQLEQDLFDLKRSRNELSPISLLPAEILTTIFCLSRKGIDWSGRCKRLPDFARLAHVCHAWREIALDSPSLWTLVQIRPTTARELVQYQLINARGSFLTLEYVDKSNEPAHLDILSNVLDRTPLKSITLCAQDFVIRQVLCGVKHWVAYLAELVIECRTLSYSNSHIVLPQHISGGIMPKLHRLSLSNYILPWISPILSSPNLKDLTLGSNYHPSGRITGEYMIEFLSFLRRTPHLEVLNLSFPPTSAGPLNAPDGLAEVELPAIETLSINASDSKPLTLLLPLLLPNSQVGGLSFGVARTPDPADVVHGSSRVQRQGLADGHVRWGI